MRIDLNSLSEEALLGVLDEFISRDSNILDGSIETKRQQVVDAITRGDAVVTFDEGSKTTNILHRAEYEERKRRHSR